MSQCELMPMPAPSVVLARRTPRHHLSGEWPRFSSKRHDDVVRDVRNIIDNCPKPIYCHHNFEAS